MSPPGKKMGVTTNESELKYSLVVHLVERGVAECRQKDLLDEVGGQLATAAMAQHNALVVEDGDGAGAKWGRRWDDVGIVST